MSYLKEFSTAISGKPFLVLDTETTGLGHRDEVCQIAIIDATGSVLLDSLVAPTIPIPPGATAVHGITNDLVVDAPTWAEVAPLVQDIITGHPLIVYNANYDRGIMYQSNAVHQLDIKWGLLTPWHCAMTAYAEFWGDWNNYHHSYRWQSLSNACQQQRLPVVDAHTAQGDCQMTLAVINRMLEVNHG